MYSSFKLIVAKSLAKLSRRINMCEQTNHHCLFFRRGHIDLYAKERYTLRFLNASYLAVLSGLWYKMFTSLTYLCHPQSHHGAAKRTAEAAKDVHCANRMWVSRKKLASM
jgi:hypothetical protein